MSVHWVIHYCHQFPCFTSATSHFRASSVSAWKDPSRGQRVNPNWTGISASVCRLPTVLRTGKVRCVRRGGPRRGFIVQLAQGVLWGCLWHIRSSVCSVLLIQDGKLLLFAAVKKLRLSRWTPVPFSASVSNKLQASNFMIQNHGIDQLEGNLPCCMQCLPAGQCCGEMRSCAGASRVVLPALAQPRDVQCNSGTLRTLGVLVFWLLQCYHKEQMICFSENWKNSVISVHLSAPFGMSLPV